MSGLSSGVPTKRRQSSQSRKVYWQCTEDSSQVCPHLYGDCWKKIILETTIFKRGGYAPMWPPSYTSGRYAAKLVELAYVCVCRLQCLKVRAHLTTIRRKTPHCSHPRTLRLQVANYFHKHYGRLFGRNSVDDCPLFWFAAVSAVCKQCILLTTCFTVYLLLIYPCK